MPLKIVRNDIIKMNTQAIVNTANDYPTVGTGCDHVIYTAAGYDELLAYRREHIGFVPEGEVFITPAFNLDAEYIIHVVSTLYEDGAHHEDEKLRGCYQKALALAKDNGIKSISFPLMSTGGFGYPKEEGLRIALDEIYAFLEKNEMEVYVVVFGEESTKLGRAQYPDLESYIDDNYVEEKEEAEYDSLADFLEKWEPSPNILTPAGYDSDDIYSLFAGESESQPKSSDDGSVYNCKPKEIASRLEDGYDDAIQKLQSDLQERYEHLQDSFSEYLLYLIDRNGMTNAEVYRNAIVTKQTFAKIKADPLYHPQKITALCLCVGAKLSLDDTNDLLGRAGYALSPSDMQDVIFSYFIENEIYDMVELDIQLENYGFDCVIK